VRLRREHVVVGVIWLLGLASLAAVLVLHDRLDQRRQAQIAVVGLRMQVSTLPKIALGLNAQGNERQTQAELDAGEARLTESIRELDRFAGNHTDSRLLLSEARPLFPLLARANAIASAGQLRLATITLGLSLLPGQDGYRLNETFATIGTRYGHEASSASRLAEIGTVVAILLLLVAVSIVLWRASRLARENHMLAEQSRQDALTDELTGLANRRKLFTDLEELTRPDVTELALLGVLDLDGFKAYNDRFGHPAGDTLLARLGRELRAAVEGHGSAYRIGGDEFCVIARGPYAEAVLERACATLALPAGGLSITCSLGAARLKVDGSTADELLRKADERLYEHKRSSRDRSPLARGADGPRAVAV
jgi:diguanylate cyclase (GGDEF)-like protein